MSNKLTPEAKAAMIANLQLELEARKEKLRAQFEAQCASLQSRLERRINRIPPGRRQATLSAHLAAQAAPPSSSQGNIATAKVTKSGSQKKTAAAKGRVAPATKRSANTAPANTRATRAATRTREVLSPKTDNAKPKVATRAAKPR